MRIKIPIEVSARHVHLSKEHADILFGKDYKFNIFKSLSQREQYAYEEKVKLAGPRGNIDEIRVLGPCRPETQVEITETEARQLGIHAPVLESGDLAASAGGVKIIGPAGEVELEKGVIVTLRHVHINPETAQKFGLKHGDKVKVDVSGVRDLIFENVVVRVHPKFCLAMHIDTDEANAAEINAENHEGELIVN